VRVVPVRVEPVVAAVHVAPQVAAPAPLERTDPADTVKARFAAEEARVSTPQDAAAVRSAEQVQQRQYEAPAPREYQAPVQREYQAPAPREYQAPVQREYAAPVARPYAAPAARASFAERPQVRRTDAAPAARAYAAPRGGGDGGRRTRDH
jgi:hypothetical protein